MAEQKHDLCNQLHCFEGEDDCPKKNVKPWEGLRQQGVFTVDDLIEKLSALPPDIRMMPMLFATDGWYEYVGELKSPLDGDMETWVFPTLYKASRGFDPRDA